MITLHKQPYSPPVLASYPLIDSVQCGDALAVLRRLPDHCIDALCVDPPSGIHFMSSTWDSDKGGRDQWIAWLAEIMRECLRVVKPGGHAFIWALPRTSHWTATAVEDAGWEIREKFYHCFGSGFPKSQDISKQIDKMQGKEREVLSSYQRSGRSNGILGNHVEITHTITAPASPEAAHWQGWGTATKPAVEEWILARAPLAERTIAAQVLATGTGAINIDATRINPGEIVPGGGRSWGASDGTHEGWKRPAHQHYENKEPHTRGRWPSNLLLSHSLWCERIGTTRVKGHATGYNWEQSENENPTHVIHNIKSGVHYGDEEIEAWHCHPSCPVRSLDEQSGIRKSGGVGSGNHTDSAWFGGGKHALDNSYPGSTGGASRFFARLTPSLDDLPPFVYCPKPSRRERNSGCEGLPERGVQRYGVMQGTPEHAAKQDTPETNNHPTVKPVSLIKYLLAMIVPENGIVLDCFAGSGTTGVAAVSSGFHYLLIDENPEYVAIAEARI